MGRAAWCARGRRPARFCCLLPRQSSGRRAACPPARRPRRELRSARRLEARPGPAGLAAASNRSGLVVSVLSVSLRCRPPAPRPGPSVPPAPFTPVGPGVLMGGWARRFVVRPGRAGPTAASGQGLVCVHALALTSPTGTAARPPPSHRTRIERSLPTFLSPPPISHASPPRPFQILKSDRRNCNVFRLR